MVSAAETVCRRIIEGGILRASFNWFPWNVGCVRLNRDCTKAESCSRSDRIHSNRTKVFTCSCSQLFFFHVHWCRLNKKYWSNFRELCLVENRKIYDYQILACILFNYDTAVLCMCCRLTKRPTNQGNCVYKTVNWLLQLFYHESPHKPVEITVI